MDITGLPAGDLSKLRESLSQDVQLITNNFGNLKVAQARYAQALEALADLTPSNLNTTCMVPLTGSLYIPGKLSNVKTVLVDIGTPHPHTTPSQRHPVLSTLSRLCCVLTRWCWCWCGVWCGVGTGYFVEKSVSDARVFLQGKLVMLSDNIDKVGMALSAKRRDLEAVTVVLQAKVQAIKSAQDKQVQELIS